MTDKITTEEQGDNKVFSVEIDPGDEVTLATADTYVDKNIHVKSKSTNPIYKTIRVAGNQTLTEEDINGYDYELPEDPKYAAALGEAFNVDPCSINLAEIVSGSWVRYSFVQRVEGDSFLFIDDREPRRGGYPGTYGDSKIGVTRKYILLTPTLDPLTDAVTSLHYQFVPAETAILLDTSLSDALYSQAIDTTPTWIDYPLDAVTYYALLLSKMSPFNSKISMVLKGTSFSQIMWFTDPLATSHAAQTGSDDEGLIDYVFLGESFNLIIRENTLGDMTSYAISLVKAKGAGGGGGTTYTEGTGIKIDNTAETISIDEDVVAQKSDLSVLQPKLTAGANIVINEDNVISAVSGEEGMPPFPAKDPTKQYMLGLIDDPDTGLYKLAWVFIVNVDEESY